MESAHDAEIRRKFFRLLRRRLEIILTTREDKIKPLWLASCLIFSGVILGAVSNTLDVDSGSRLVAAFLSGGVIGQGVLYGFQTICDIINDRREWSRLNELNAMIQQMILSYPHLQLNLDWDAHVQYIASLANQPNVQEGVAPNIQESQEIPASQAVQPQLQQVVQHEGNHREPVPPPQGPGSNVAQRGSQGRQNESGSEEEKRSIVGEERKEDSEISAIPGEREQNEVPQIQVINNLQPGAVYRNEIPSAGLRPENNPSPGSQQSGFQAILQSPTSGHEGKKTL